MKIAKFILGIVAAGVLLAGGFMAGTFITQPRASSAPAFLPVQPTYVPQQRFQPTQIPQTTPPVIPPQGQWEHGWMMDMNPNYSPQGQRGWGMHDWDNNNCCGWSGGMMNGWQNNPNWNVTPSAPNGSTTYPTPTTSVSFKDDVQPIFAARCVTCHGGTNGLYLDTYENIIKGGINGAVVVPSDVYNSRLAYYVYSGYMPFRNTSLASTEIQTILDWIAAGAPNN